MSNKQCSVSVCRKCSNSHSLASKVAPGDDHVDMWTVHCSAVCVHETYST